MVTYLKFKDIAAYIDFAHSYEISKTERNDKKNHSHRTGE